MVLYVSNITNGTSDRNEIIPSATRFISHHLSTNRTDYAFVFSIVIEHRRRNIMTITGSKFKWAGVGIATNECTKLQQVETLSIHPTDASCISCYFSFLPSPRREPENVFFKELRTYAWEQSFVS